MGTPYIFDPKHVLSNVFIFVKKYRFSKNHFLG